MKKWLLLLMTPLVLGACDKDDTSRTEIWTIASEKGVAGITMGFGYTPAYIVQKGVNASWEIVPGSIEGFSFEEGWQTTLRVRIDRIANPPADGRSERYTMEEQLARTETTTPVDPLTFSPELEIRVASRRADAQIAGYWIQDLRYDMPQWQAFPWEIEGFDYSSNSLYQVLRDEKSEKVTMVIKIDENSTIVTVLSAGKVLLQRTVAYGVQDAIDTMIASGAYAVNDPMSAVERFQKKTCLNRVLHQGDKVWEENAGRWEDEDAGNVEVTEARQKITASLEPLIVGVSRVIDFYDSRNSENPIEKSYVTGLGGSFSGMSKLFTNCLERKVHTLSEMDDKIGMSKAIRSTRPAAYISCLGAVLAPVGLIDKSTQKSKGLTVVSGTNYTFVSVAVLVLGVILSIAMAATSVTRYLGNVAQNVYLQNRVQELQPAQAVYNDYLAAEAQYDKYTYLYAYTQTPNENLVEFINELEQILPDSFYTNSFSSDQTGISMSVTVEGKAAAARTILNIRNMQSIDDVEISNITDSKDETGTSIVTFSITGSYKELTDETEESGEAQADTQTAQ